MMVTICPGRARHMAQPQCLMRPPRTAWPSAISPLLASIRFCEFDLGVTNVDPSSDNHQRFGRGVACRREQLMLRSISKPAMLSTATDDALNTERLIPLPKSHDSGTAPTMISSDGVSPASLKCARDS